MVVVTPKTGVLSTLARGRFGLPNGLGVIFLGWNSLGYANDRAGTYQRHRIHGGKKLIRRWQNWPTNHKTPAQVAWQTVFGVAVNEWCYLTKSQQEEYNRRNRTKGMGGQQLFIKEYLLSHKISP